MFYPLFQNWNDQNKMLFFLSILNCPVNFLSSLSIMENLWSSVFLNTYSVGTGISTLKSIYVRYGPYFFRQKMEKTQLLTKEKGEKLFFPPELAQLLCNYFVQSFFRTFYLDLACKQRVFPPRKGFKQDNWKY